MSKSLFANILLSNLIFSVLSKIMFVNFIIFGPIIFLVRVLTNIYLSAIILFFKLSLLKENFILIWLSFEFNSQFTIVVMLDKLSVKIVICFLMFNNLIIILLIQSTFFTHSEELIYLVS